MRVEGAVVRAVVRAVDPVGAGDSGGVAVREERAVRPAVGAETGCRRKAAVRRVVRFRAEIELHADVALLRIQRIHEQDLLRHVHHPGQLPAALGVFGQVEITVQPFAAVKRGGPARSAVTRNQRALPELVRLFVLAAVAPGGFAEVFFEKLRDRLLRVGEQLRRTVAAQRRIGDEVLIIPGVHDVGVSELFGTGDAVGAFRPGPRLIQRRQQHGRQNGDDGYHD